MVFKKGYKQTEEHKKKIGLANKGRNKGKHFSQSTEFKKGQVSPRKGIKLSQKEKNHLSKFRKGKTYEEIYGKEKAKKQRKIISSFMKKNHPLKGKYHSEKTKRKMSLAKVGLISNMKGRTHKELSKIKMSATKLGVKIQEWKGYSREPYDQSWNSKFRNAIRKRDNQICMLCKIHREKLNQALSIHHINYDKKLTIPQNCISLCISCHSKTNMNRKHWIKFFQSLLVETYNYNYQENKIIVRVGN